MEKIVLGGGCFWCIEAVYKRIRGVEKVVPGYAGGSSEGPTYEQVCSGSSDHAEVVEVSYYVQMVDLDTILEVFWQAHDPTTLNRQGHDVGQQYRSVILYTNEEQRRIVEDSLRRVRGGMRGSGREPVTEIGVLGKFWPAEVYHVDYYNNNRNAVYCRMVIEPKLEKLRRLKML